ncbi:hypothetical protein N0A02_21370 [Paraburkholderia acidicola]|uniref:Uncharacterized protein n=1 Tax=Paraburkholderia acidicola TaxID=1912599 RepID=A0ABV1LS11_9BURK
MLIEIRLTRYLQRMIVGTVAHQTTILPMPAHMNPGYALAMLNCFQLMHVTNKKHMIRMGKTDVHGQSCTASRHVVRLIDNINHADHIGMSSPVGPYRNTVVTNQ